MESHQEIDGHGREVPKQVPRVAADAIVTRHSPNSDGHEIMLITRKKATF